MGGPGKETQEAQEEEDDTDTRIEVLAAIQSLKRLNKTQYSPEERYVEDLYFGQSTLWMDMDVGYNGVHNATMLKDGRKCCWKLPLII